MNYDDYKLGNPYRDSEPEPDHDSLRQQRRENAFYEAIERIQEPIAKMLRKKFYETDDKEVRFMLLDIAQTLPSGLLSTEFLDILMRTNK